MKKEAGFQPPSFVSPATRDNINSRAVLVAGVMAMGLIIYKWRVRQALRNILRRYSLCRATHLSLRKPGIPKDSVWGSAGFYDNFVRCAGRDCEDPRDLDWSNAMMYSSRIKWFTEISYDCRGTEIAEAALVLPLVFMLLLGIIWFGRAFNIYSTLSHAAREGARVAAVPTCATCVPFGTPCYWSSSTFPCDRTIDETVTDALKASRVDPTQIFAYTPNPSPVACPGLDPAAACSVTSNKITICRGMRINSAVSNLPECGTIVSFAYPYQFYFPFTSLNHQRIGLHAAAEMRMEY